MTQWHPLRFEPVYKQYLWGGTRLRTALGRELDPRQTYAESWEICDHDSDQSRVLAGPFAGATLHELFLEHRREVLGQQAVDAPPGVPARFPLLLKYLDAARDLSLQVHPDDAVAAKLTPPDFGKSEAWIVLEAEPGSLIYAGLGAGVDRAALAEAIRRGTCRECVHAFETKPGDCVFIPAGTVHALGAGLLVAEIQTSSDTTFRLYDWNRLGPDGKPRPLHVEQGLAATDFARGPVEPLRRPIGEEDEEAALVRSAKFALVRRAFSSPRRLGGDGRFHVLSVLDGSLVIEGDPTGRPLARGQSVLLPAALGSVQLTPLPRAVLLDACLPL
jgi:mannose-6-phosphate isomerase